MRTRSLVLSIAACLLALATKADATMPTFFTIQIDQTVVSPFFTAFCGFEVSFTQTGTLKATVFNDAEGEILAEIDTQPGFTITYSSSESGKSFTYPFSTVFHFEYPNGTAPGAPVLLTALGLQDKVPGVPADAGLVTYANAIVLFVNAEGIPIVDFGAPTAFQGNANDLVTVFEAGCAALAP